MLPLLSLSLLIQWPEKKCIAISQIERVILQYKQSKKIIKETMRKRNRSSKKNPIGNHTMVAYVRSVRRDLHRTYVKIITKFLIFTFTISPLAHIIFPQTHTVDSPALSGNHLLPYNTQTHVHHFMSTFLHWQLIYFCNKHCNRNGLSDKHPPHDIYLCVVSALVWYCLIKWPIFNDNNYI